MMNDTTLTIPGFSSLHKVFSLIICLSTPLSATSHIQELKNCKDILVGHMKGKDVEKLRNCPISEKLSYWFGILKNPSQYSAKELIVFLDKHPHWPQHNALCRKAEETIAKGSSNKEIIAWFTKHPPETPVGIIGYGKALLANQQKAKAKEVATKAWHSVDFSRDEEAKFFSAFSSLLTSHDHAERLDFLLWNNHLAEAKRMLSRVPQNTQKLSQARIALLEGKSEPSNVSADLKKNEGYIFAKANKLKKNHQYEAAANLIMTAPISTKWADHWWNLQNYVARELIADRKYDKAYQLSIKHKLQPRTENYANARWIAGWLALQFLKKPDKAKIHFENLFAHVNSALSKSRAAYWMGRVFESTNQNDLARNWYSRAAKYNTTYYGQLAASKIQHQPHPKLEVKSSVTNAIRAKLQQNDLVKAAHILRGLGPDAKSYLSSFIRHIADKAESKSEREFAVELAHDIASFDVVWAARKAGLAEPITLKKAYPHHPLPKGATPTEHALLMAITYQESRFDPSVKSHAGAIGLMQLMPQTARQEARKLGIPYKESKLYDPHHNIHLGSSHISSLLTRFDKSYILAIAAYNAGHAPVERWLQTFGDPRKGQIDIIDWVELIPYAETRNYVMRVLETITVYRSHEGIPKATLIHDLTR